MGNKPKLIFLVSRFPYPLEKGDKLRAYYQLRELSEYYRITLVAVSDREVTQEQIEQLSGFTERIVVLRVNWLSIIWNMFLCLFNSSPFQVGYFHSYRNRRKVLELIRQVEPDHIYCQLIRSAEYVKDYHNCPKTLDYMDAFSKGMERRIVRAPFYLKRLIRSEASRLKNYERRIFDYFEFKSIISEQDRELILHPERKEIRCIPNGIDQKFFTRPEEKVEFDLVFVGNLSYAPNVEAVEFIAEELLPLDRKLTCLISGATPSPRVQRICAASNTITLQGWVEDIRTSYVRGSVFIAPMMIGTGMQNKLLEAMALGIPCVTTPLACDAIKATDGKEIIVAKDADEFIRAIHLLKTDSERYDSISKHGKQFVLSHYSWKTSVAQLHELMESTNVVH